MYYDDASLADATLNYLYFNHQCDLSELVANLLRHPEISDKQIHLQVKELMKEYLVMREGKYFSLTAEGRNAVENYNSYMEYLSLINAPSAYTSLKKNY